MRYEYDRDSLPPRYSDYPESHFRDREFRDGNLRGSGGREMRDVRDFRDIRDLRDLRDVRELREIGYREGGTYPHPPPGPPLSPRSYNARTIPPQLGFTYGMDNGSNVAYPPSVYRSGGGGGGGGGGGFYTPSASPSPPRSPYSPTSSMYVHQPPPSRQSYTTVRGRYPPFRTKT